MDTFYEIQEALKDILDIEATEITLETYLIRQLGAESIDLLELAVELNQRFKKEINDDDLFLRPLRLYLNEAKEKGIDAAKYVKEKFSFLSMERIVDILSDLDEGPVLKVGDIVSYIDWKRGEREEKTGDGFTG